MPNREALPRLRRWIVALWLLMAQPESTRPAMIEDYRF